ncbi:MAG: BREX-1 system adenine-specific DNA-methyltransferase PglX, partial [Synergistaceae bacterium]|nr:BREX-1 system adenine-specific DNA-methyltransferase PglX [Synergistaceae bacterium]
PANDSGSPANDSGSPANDSGSPAADSGLPADAGRRHAKFDVEKIKFLDPCMGCGHILIYAFDVFMQIYRWMGYADRDAAKLILEKNLYGLEIDQRACQLAAFSLMMKAKQYNCDIAPFVPLNSLLAPQCKEQHIALPASSLTSPSEEQRSALPTSLLMSLCKTQQITPLAPTPASPLAPQCKEQHIVPQVFHPCGFEDGMEFGSLLRAEDLDGLPHANGGRHNAFCDESDAPSANARRRDTFSDGADNIHVPSDADNIHYSSCADCIPYPSDADNIHDLSCADCIPDPSSADNMHNPSCADNIHDLSGADSIPDPSGAYNFFHLLAQKYDLVVTNPPYLGKSGMNDRLARFVKEKYPDSKSDLFAAFIERCGEFLKPHGLQAMITMESWMFLSCYESLRQKLFRTRAIINLIHMPYLGRGGTSLGINFGTSMFVMSKQTIKGYLGQYGCIRFYETDDDGVPFTFPTENERYKTTSARNFEKIPGAPVAYWVSEKVFDIFAAGKSINEMSDFTGSQNITSDNERYLRFIWEVGAAEIGRGRRWTFYAKGGDYRKWYGNIEYLVDISDAAKNYYKSNQTANLLSKEYWYREGITYSAVTSKGTGFRYLPPIGGFDKGGATLCDVQNIYYILALLNSKVAEMAFKILNPTINMQIRDIKALPIFVDDEKLTTIERLAKENIQLSNADWDAFETSKDFKRHPLLGHLNA